MLYAILILLIVVDVNSLQNQTFGLRMFHSFTILIVCIELFRAASSVDNARASRYVWKCVTVLFAYFSTRTIAGLLDTWLAYSIGWFSNAVQIVFWLFLFWKARHLRVILQSPQNSELRIKVRKTLDDLIDQIEESNANVQRKLERI